MRLIDPRVFNTLSLIFTLGISVKCINHVCVAIFRYPVRFIQNQEAAKHTLLNGSSKEIYLN